MGSTVVEDVEYQSDPEEAKGSLAMRRSEASDDEEGGDKRAVEEEVEYESDPEEANMSLAMRRTVASDDEEGEGEGVGGDEREDRRVGVLSDGSDGEGGVADYDDGGDDIEEDLEEEEDEEEEEVVDEEVEEDVYDEQGASGVEGSMIVVKETDGDVGPSLEDSAEVNSEEKKENEPFAVPTAGAFYMHDDRFRDIAGANNRRIRGGGSRLWESKDERKWGHDKFEEITLHERHYEERRTTSRVNYRGGRNRSTDRGGHIQGNRKAYNESSQNQVRRVVVKGRGPRRYDPTNKSIAPGPQVHNKQSRKSYEKISHVRSERTSTPASNAESDPVPARKQSLASNLNYESPPFYPSGSSNKEINLAHNRNEQIGSASKDNALLQGKNLVDSISMDNLYIDKSSGPSVGKPLNNVHRAPPRSSGVNAFQSSLPMAAGTGRGIAIPVQMNYQPAPSHNHVNKVSPVQHQANQRSYAPGRPSASGQYTTQQLGHRPASRSQSSSPPKTSASFNSLDSVDMDAASESGKAKGALVGNGKGGSQGTGRGSFVYGGAQVMGVAGNGGVNHGDPNFPATPAFLPVVQFRGQHPGGMGVPAVGMAFPGYVAQPGSGGKSEMTWLPVLAGAAGALGGSYCSPYLAVDGAYTRQSGQTSAMGNSSKEHNDVNKSNNNELKPAQKSELVSDEYGQRQNKPRRYSEMNFGQ